MVECKNKTSLNLKLDVKITRVFFPISLSNFGARYPFVTLSKVGFSKTEESLMFFSLYFSGFGVRLGLYAWVTRSSTFKSDLPSFLLVKLSDFFALKALLILEDLTSVLQHSVFDDLYLDR